VDDERLTESERSVVESVSVDRLMHDTREIAQWVRLSGSAAERLAFEYVADVLHGLGLEPRLEWADAYISLPESARLQVLGRDVPAITHSMAASTPPEGVTLPLVDGAAGLDAVDLRGKAVIADGLATGNIVIPVQEAGGAAVIFVNADEHVHEMIVSNVWGSPTPETRGKLPRIPVVSVARTEGERIRQELAHDPGLQAHLTTLVDTGWRPIPTLTVQVDGAVEPETFVLFSGHIDSWHHGAMDNGSANATMLETLRAMLQVRDRLRRSLRLAFWSGHSHGRYAGSTWYADTHWQELHEHCVLHLNVDSTGGEGATNLNSTPVMAATRPVAARVLEPLMGARFTGVEFTRAGDQSFMGHGIPSLFMSLSEQPPATTPSISAELVGAGLGWWWHTPDDTIERIDPALLLRDTRVYALVTYRLLSEALLPLDVTAAARDLLAALEGWAGRAGDRFDLGPALQAAREVVAATRSLHPSPESMNDEETARVNRAVHAALRALVPLRYVAGDRFGYDSGVPQPPVPLLAPIDELLETEPGSTDAHLLETLLRRRRNRLVHGLKEALQALGREAQA
jgi:hypothetical protein